MTTIHTLPLLACAILGLSSAFPCESSAQSKPRLKKPVLASALSTPAAKPATTSPTPTRLALGEKHSCVIRSDSSVSCWGSNARGQLGQTVNVSKPVLPPSSVAGLKQVLSLAAGREHTCALLSDRTVRCWGDNDHGQLGDGTQTSKAVPTVVPKLANVISLAAGSSNTCAVRSDGTVWCWGENDSAQAGSTGPNLLVPTQVEGVTRAVTVRTHSNNTCATSSDGELFCWGSNVHQQLGKKAGTRSAAPVRIANKSKVSAVSVGYDFLCSLDDRGAVSCWGWNQGSRTGQSDQDLMFDVTEAKPLASKLPFTRLASGSGHACVLRNDGAVWCWGKNAFGAAGASESGAPSPISGLEQASEIAAGSDHSCALRADGSVHCWGANLSGQLGTAASVKSLVPVRAL